MKKISDLLWAPVGEGLLLLAAAIGYWARQPLVFASLGPTAYELIEQPHRPSARLYNIFVGHLIGIGSGFLSIYLLHAWNAPSISASHLVPAVRIWTVVLAAALTALITLSMKATQPAALATSILISSGAMQTVRSAIAIIVGVAIVTFAGRPLRDLRLRGTAQARS